MHRQLQGLAALGAQPNGRGGQLFRACRFGISINWGKALLSVPKSLFLRFEGWVRLPWRSMPIWMPLTGRSCASSSRMAASPMWTVRRVGILRHPACGASSGSRNSGINQGLIARCSTTPLLGFHCGASGLIGSTPVGCGKLKAIRPRRPRRGANRAARLDGVGQRTDFMHHAWPKDLSTFQTFVIEQLTSNFQCRHGPQRR